MSAPSTPSPPDVNREHVAAIVRAIRRAYGSQSCYGGLERFTVADIHDFARRLAEQGVRAGDAE